MKRLYKILAIVTISLATSLATYAVGFGEGYSQLTTLIAIGETSCVSDGEPCRAIYYFSTYCDDVGWDYYCAAGGFQEYYPGTCYWPVPEIRNVYYCMQ